MTIDINTRIENIRNFYSHALVGRDIIGAYDPATGAISTHTPSWGVTVIVRFRIPAPRDFYSHALVGRD